MSTGTQPMEVVTPVTPTVRTVTGPADIGLSASEINRRVLHMSPGLLPFLLWIFPHQDPWGPLLVNITIGLFITIIAIALARFQLFARPGEHDFRPSVLGYALPVLAALCLYRGREEIGLITLAILAFGDGSATLGALLMGGKPLPWNPAKSWTGTICFVLCATPVAALVYWGECRPSAPLGSVLLIALGTSVAAAIAESLPVRMNDNLRVGTTAAILGGVLTLFMVG